MNTESNKFTPLCWGISSNSLYYKKSCCVHVLENSPTNQLVISQVADWPTSRLVNSPTANFQKSWNYYIYICTSNLATPNLNSIKCQLTVFKLCQPKITLREKIHSKFSAKHFGKLTSPWVDQPATWLMAGRSRQRTVHLIHKIQVAITEWYSNHIKDRKSITHSQFWISDHKWKIGTIVVENPVTEAKLRQRKLGMCAVNGCDNC